MYYDTPATRHERGPLDDFQRAQLDRMIRAGAYVDREIAHRVGCSNRTVVRRRRALTKEKK